MRVALLTFVGIAWASAVGAAVPVEDVDPNATIAPYFVVPRSDDGADPLPLETSRASVRIIGSIAHVTLKQRWKNQGDVPLEATYVFPTSTRAAVHGVTMRVGERVLRAKIAEKEAARATFERAKDAGRTAALFESARPNVVQMAVANIMPDDVIDIDVEYSELVQPIEGVYELALPHVVGPRYVSAAETEASAGFARAPVLRARETVPFAWGVDVALAMPVPLVDVWSPSHAIAPVSLSATTTAFSLDDRDDPRGGTRDLVVRYRLAGDDVATGVMLHRARGASDGHFLVQIEPPHDLKPGDTVPREVIFVVDVSGSMSGRPTEIVLAAMDALLAQLGNNDAFNVLTFAGGSATLAPASIPATRGNRVRVAPFLRGAPSGGTELLPALRHAFSLPTIGEGVARSFVVLTDGYVSIENEAYRLVLERRADANVFAFGIGSSVNRHLIESLARAGGGDAFFALDDDEAAREVARFARMLARPALTDVKVTFDGFDAFDVEGATPTDLFVDRPIAVLGRFRGPVSGSVVIEGTTAHGSFRRTLAIEDVDERPAYGSLGVLFARARLRRLVDFADDPSSTRADALALALRYSLLSQYTSFVVVDDVVRNDGGRATPVAQPAPLPDGVSERAVGPITYRNGATIDFSDLSIEGELTKPEGSYLQSRKRVEHESMIPVRESFRAEMLASAGSLDGETIGLGSIGTVGYGSGSGIGTALGTGGLGIRGAGAGGGGNAMDVAGRGKGTSHVEALVMGSLDKSSIDGVVAKHGRAARACHERRKAVPGKVTLSFAIGATGRVKDVRIVEDTVADEKVASCLTRIVRRWRFPAPDGGGDVVVTYPFVFDAAK